MESPVREKARARLVRSLGGNEALGHDVERCLWKAVVRSFPASQRYWSNPRLKYRYTNKVLGIAFNLSHPKNPRLQQRLKDGEITPKHLMNMTPIDMWPEEWAPVLERVARRQMRKERPLEAATAADGVFQCRACKSRKTQYTQLQTRSADEPMTTFILCCNCGKRWRQ